MYHIPTPQPLAALPGAGGTRFIEPPAPTEPWLRALETIKRRWRLLACVFAAIFLAVTVITLTTKREYTTEIKLIAGNTSSNVAQSAQTNLPVLNALLASGTAQTSETYAELIRETPVANAVVKRLNLHASAGAVLSHIKVRPVINTNILALDATWSDPQTSARIANAFGSEFVTREKALIARQASGVVDTIAAQLPTAARHLRDSDNALSRFQSSHKIVDMTTQTTGAVNALATIDAKINSVQLDRDQAQAQIGSLSGQIAGMSSNTAGSTQVEPNPVYQQLRTQLAQAEATLHAAQQQYTDEHPTVVNGKAAVSTLRSELAKQAPTIVARRDTVANPVYQQLSQQLAASRAAAASANSQLAELQTQRATLAPQLAALPGDIAALAELQRKQKTSLDVYNGLSQKYNDALVAQQTALSDVTIVQPALADAYTVHPDVKLNIMLGAFLALLIGLGAVYAVEFFDKSIKDQAEIERELALPVLANIPQLPTGDAAALPAARYAVVESFLQLVTALRYSSDKALRTIAITSPNKGDGKSTIAMNVALALGELAVINLDPLPDGHLAREPRVLLIDADLRRPSLHRKMSLPNTGGLSDVLTGNAKLLDVVQTTKFPGLDVLSSGTMSPNPIKLLQSERFDAVLAEAARYYTTIILDAPAMLPVFDAAILSVKADGTIMVVSAGATDLPSTRRALARLESVGVREFIGIVVNRSTEKIDDYSDYFEFAPGPEVKQLASSAAGSS